MRARLRNAPIRKTFAEFFAGIGLMRMGLERAGWTALFANDIDADKEEMYRGQYNESNGMFCLGDIHRLDAASVPDVTLATASFPCNDLSLAGARAGLAGKQSSAYWGFLSILERMGERRPPLVLLENVAGFLTSHGGEDFRQAMAALNRLGYLVDSFMIDAVRFVPQSRVRMFVVGSLKGSQRTMPKAVESDARPNALVQFIASHPEIRWSIRELPLLPPKLFEIDEGEEMMDISNIVEKLPPSSPHWWSEERTEYLLGQMSDKHRKLLTQMRSSRVRTYGTVFRRVRNRKCMAELRTDGIAGCLRTPRGGSGRQILVEAGRGRVRARLLTPRECARLMGADDYVINVPLNRALFGFGDAVCVPVVSWIAENYLNPLLQELQPSEKRTGRSVPNHAIAE